jgi:RNA polymerase subunit RPABC4/transcription elongation factor Spt4
VGKRNFTGRKEEHCLDCGHVLPGHKTDCYKIVSHMRARGLMCRDCHRLLASGATCPDHPPPVT